MNSISANAYGDRTTALYDQLGVGYANGRRADPRWQVAVEQVLGSAGSVVNVGAGTGSYSYEPTGRRVLAVEPSDVMIQQRSAGAAPAIRGAAEKLPLGDQTFDVAMAVSTPHHWTDWRAGIAEMRRVASRVVILHFDPAVHDNFWLVHDYLPELSDVWRATPTPVQVSDALGPQASIQELPVPWDCVDGFLSAYWRRPAAYLEPALRQCMSGLQALDPAILERGIEALRSDLQAGEWNERNADVVDQTEFDGGWRLIFN